MNIIFICKRYYTAKDLINDQFGRLYEIPDQLARMGHHVKVICLDYHNAAPCVDYKKILSSGSIEWRVFGYSKFISHKSFLLLKSLKSFKPNIIFGSSDIPCLLAARFLALHLKLPYAVDLYDNYESFKASHIPGLRYALKTTIRRASAVFVVSNILKRKVIMDYNPIGEVVVITNGTRSEFFFSGDKSFARCLLKLPQDKLLIGTAGGLSRMKGLEVVYNAWNLMKKNHDDIFLVLAGRIDPKLPIPKGDGVIYLGELNEEQVGNLFRALDVGIISALDSEFGRYCFPQKLYEMVLCELPLVAARVGEIANILKPNQDMLYEADSPIDLSESVLKQLKKKKLTGLVAKEWPELVRNLERTLLKVATRVTHC